MGLFLAAGLSASTGRGADPPADAKTLEKPLAAKLAELKVPGAVVGVYRDKQPPVELALGYADADAKTPMTADCHVRIASVSKVFIATALLTLIDDGIVSADDPISKYVAGVPNGDKITLRHLATHRSGLFNPIESRAVKAAFADDPRKEWNENTILKFSFAEKPYFEPGEKHHYSNVNTILLAQVIAKATGKPWRGEVAARVFKPLGLKETSIPTDNKLPRPFSRGYALGGKDGPFFARGDVRHDVTETSPSWWGAAGNLISTPGDLGRAMKPLATGALLKEKGKKELLAWTKADQAGFDYGFHIERTDGMIGHDGDVPGYQTFAFYLPDEDATVVAVATLYGWSVRGMPANDLAKEAIRRTFPHREKRLGVERGLRPFAEAEGKPQRWTLAERMAEHRVPGVSVAVIDGGKVVWVKGYGVRDAVSADPVTTTTRFQAGSVSKVAAATLALRLADAGKFDLDGDVNTLLTDWKLAREDKWKESPVTVRRLLSHTGGVGGHGFVGYQRADGLPTNRQVLAGDSKANSPAVKVTAEPGTGESYSGGGYQIVQQVLADVSGTPFDELAVKELFAPLKLSATSFSPPAETATDIAFAHDTAGKRLAISFLRYPESAAAGLWSTPSDIANLALAIRSAHAGEPGAILKPKTAAEMLAPVKLAGKVGGHGLGPAVYGEGKTLRFGHSGGTVGFRCEFVLFVESGQGAVVMTNGAGDALMTELLRAVAAEHNWPGTDFAPKVRKAATLTADQLAAYAGDYAIEGNNTPYTVRASGDELLLETKFKAAIRLLPLGNGKFFGTSHDREVHFESKDGKVIAAEVKYDTRTLFRLLRK
jgi:CubicO group peptidase (beta-lactamase class C family)